MIPLIPPCVDALTFAAAALGVLIGWFSARAFYHSAYKDALERIAVCADPWARQWARLALGWPIEGKP